MEDINLAFRILYTELRIIKYYLLVRVLRDKLNWNKLVVQLIVGIFNYETNPEVTMTDETLAERNVLITSGYKLV